METEIPLSTIANTIATPIDGDFFFVPAVSRAMRSIERSATDIAATGIPVLLVGESGTGKSALAWTIHKLSRHRDEPFLALKCALLTPESFQRHAQAKSEELSDSWYANGTVFLDELGELDSTCQRKLLNVLPDSDDGQGKFQSSRVISATRYSLEAAVRSGHFREDLYYRLRGVCLRLPLLRQRKEDIPLLINYFLSKYAALFKKSKAELSPRAITKLQDYPWPGNIRELEHTIQKIVAFGDEQLALNDLFHSQSGLSTRTNGAAREGLSLKQAARQASREAEKALILKVLAHTRWNRKLAAQQLQISYKALLYKLKQIKVDSDTSYGGEQ